MALLLIPCGKGREHTRCRPLCELMQGCIPTVCRNLRRSIDVAAITLSCHLRDDSRYFMTSPRERTYKRFHLMQS
jgi:hypothetical protein